MTDPLARLPGPVRAIVVEKAGSLGLTPAELATRVWEKEREVPAKHKNQLDRLFGALYGVFVELQPMLAREAFAFGPRRKGELRPRVKNWALEVFLPSIVTTSHVELEDGRIGEHILQGGEPTFIVYTPKPERWEILKEVQADRTTYRPVPVDEKLLNALTLPDGVEEYGSAGELLDQMQSLADEAYDAGSDSEAPVWRLWVLVAFASWVATELFDGLPERFLPILTVIGPSGTGKKRALSVLRAVAYRGLYFLKTTRAPSLYRSIDPWGTVFLILDEADVYESGESADFIQFLNSRADGATIPRYSPERDRNQNFLSFRFTALALRKVYADTGVNNRSVPLQAESTVRDVDLVLRREWAERARLLRRKLLLWRLRTIVRIRRGELRVPNRLDLEGVKSHRVREGLLLVAALTGEDERVMQTIRSVGADLERRLVRMNSDSIEGLILNVVYGWLDDGCDVVPDGTGWRLERETGEGEEKRRVPLTVRSVVDSLGNAISYSECARWTRGLQLGIRPRGMIDERRYKSIIRVLDPARFDRQFERFVVDSVPMADRFRRDAGGGRQERLPDGGDGSRNDFDVGVAPVGGPIRPVGPPPGAEAGVGGRSGRLTGAHEVEKAREEREGGP